MGRSQKKYIAAGGQKEKAIPGNTKTRVSHRRHCLMLKLQAGFSHFNQMLKSCRISYGEMRQVFPVNPYFCFFQAADKLAVGQSRFPHCGINPQNP